MWRFDRSSVEQNQTEQWMWMLPMGRSVAALLLQMCAVFSI